MSFNPYTPGDRETRAEIGDACSVKPGLLSICRRAAKRGGRIAAYIGGAIALCLIVPSFAMSAFALGAGRGFGLSSYFFGGFSIFIAFCMRGAMVGGMFGLL
jgi:hypothetical protein